jgi:hypothetical protein
LDNALNKVDLPTLGNPTIPHCNPIFFILGFETKYLLRFFNPASHVSTHQGASTDH